MSRRVFIPRKYQEQAIAHLLKHPRAALMLSMGLGKSVCTLTAIDALRLGGYSRPALVIAPLRVAQSVWPDEAAKWEHLRDLTVVPVTGTPAQRLEALSRDADVYATNFENVPWLFERYAERPWPFGIVVVDESTRLKSARPSMRISATGKEFVRAAGAKRVRELARIAHTPAIDRFIELTGTPAPNGLQDVWGQMWYLDAGERLGRTYEGFTQRWFKPRYNGFGVDPLPHAQQEIQGKIADLCLSIKPEMDLPPLVSNTICIDLPPQARKQYRDMEREMFVELEGVGVEAFNAAAKSMKCMQLAAGAAYIDDRGGWTEVHTAKLEALGSIIEEAAGAPVLVAYHFKSDLARIQRTFKQARVLDKDTQTIRDWNAGRIPLLLAHPQSAGHGLNLQDGGNILVFFSADWNLEAYQQMVERIGPARQKAAGHDRPVYVHHIVARRTVDELVMQRLESKRAVQDILLEAMRRKA